MLRPRYKRLRTVTSNWIFTNLRHFHDGLELGKSDMFDVSHVR